MVNSTKRRSDELSIRMVDPSTQTRASRISAQLWEDHKDVLIDLHFQGFTRSQMLTRLHRLFRLKPSIQQLSSKLKEWDLNVYSTSTRTRCDTNAALDEPVEACLPPAKRQRIEPGDEVGGRSVELSTNVESQQAFNGHNGADVDDSAHGFIHTTTVACSESDVRLPARPALGCASWVTSQGSNTAQRYGFGQQSPETAEAAFALMEEMRVYGLRTTKAAALGPFAAFACIMTGCFPSTKSLDRCGLSSLQDRSATGCRTFAYWSEVFDTHAVSKFRWRRLVQWVDRTVRCYAGLPLEDLIPVILDQQEYNCSLTMAVFSHVYRVWLWSRPLHLDQDDTRLVDDIFLLTFEECAWYLAMCVNIFMLELFSKLPLYASLSSPLEKIWNTGYHKLRWSSIISQCTVDLLTMGDDERAASCQRVLAASQQELQQQGCSSFRFNHTSQPRRLSDLQDTGDLLLQEMRQNFQEAIDDDRPDEDCHCGSCFNVAFFDGFASESTTRCCVRDELLYPFPRVAMSAS